MKTIFKKALQYTTALLLIGGAVGCESFLEEESYSFMSGEDLFNSDKSAEMALTGVYNTINANSIQGTGNDPLWSCGIHYLMMLGDEIAPYNISDADRLLISKCAYNEESSGVSHAWFGLFAGIDRANNVIANVPAIAMDEVRKAEIINEAKVLRGIFRLYLAMLWGEVPLPNVPNSPADAPRESLDKVYAAIEADFEDAYAALPDRNSYVAGRVNKWTAAGYLLKVYTYLASCKDNNVGAELQSTMNSFDWVDADAYWAKAVTVGKDIYDNSKYELIKPFYFNFMSEFKEDQKKECMMVAQTGIGSTGLYFAAVNWAGPYNRTLGGTYGYVRPTGELYERYVAEDARFSWNITSSLVDSKTETINGQKYYLPQDISSSGHNMGSGKFRQSDPASRNALGVPVHCSLIDFPMLRFADMILLYAEAVYQSEGNETLGRELMEEVRERACTDTEGNVDTAALSAMNAAYYTKAGGDFMTELLDERMRELCWEDWRRIDLIRTNKMSDVIANLCIDKADKGNNKYYYWNYCVADIQLNWAPYKMWLPVPKREREVNKNLTQNPGYAQEI